MSDDDISFSNSSVEDIDVDVIDESTGKKSVKKTRAETLAITDSAETAALPDSDSSGDDSEVRRKESPLSKYKDWVDKYTRRSNELKELIKKIEHPNSSTGKGRKAKLNSEQTALVAVHNKNLILSERKRAKALTLFEAAKRSSNLPLEVSTIESVRQSQRLLSAQQSSSSQAPEVSTQQLLEQNQSLVVDNFNRTAALVELTNLHQQQQQQAIQKLAELEIQRQEEQFQSGQQIALLATATVEAQNIAQSAQEAVASISAEKAALATQNTTVYAEASKHIAELNTKISVLQSETYNLKEQLNKAIDESANWKINCTEAARAAEEFKKQTDTAKSSYAILLQNYKTLQGNFDSTESALRTKTLEFESKAREVEGLLKRIESLAKESNLSDKNFAVELQQAVSRASELEEQVKTHEERYNKHLETLLAEIGEKTALIHSNSQTINNLNEEYKNTCVLKEQLENLVKTNIDTHEVQLKSAEEKYNASINKYSKTVDSLNQEISKLKAQVKQQESELIKFQSIERMSKGLLTTVMQTQPTMSLPTPLDAANITSELNELVSIPIRQEIRKFSGVGGERVQSWFSRSEQTARGAGWGPQLMRRYFAARLTGPAAAYQEQIDKEKKLTDYEEWKKDLIEQFKDPNETIKFKRELSEIKQRDDERVKDFKARIIKLFIKGYGEKAYKCAEPEMITIREDVLKKSLNEGLRDDIANGYWNRVKGDATFEEAVATAIEVEKVQLAKKSTSGSTVNGVINSLIQNQKDVCTNLNLITDKVKKLAVDREPKSEQLNYIEKTQRSQSPHRPQIGTDGRTKTIDIQRGRDNPLRKVRFDERPASTDSVRGRSSFRKTAVHPNATPNRYQLGYQRDFNNFRPQPGVYRQRGGVTNGKPRFNAQNDRLCFSCGSQFHFIAKCPLKLSQNRVLSREWTPQSVNSDRRGQQVASWRKD
jgi:hypothetical protein